MHLCPGRNFQFVFPLLHVNKPQCLLIVALPGGGGAPPPPSPPQPVSSAGSSCWAACLGFNKSLYQKVGVWGGRKVGVLCVYLQVICKHEVLKMQQP